MKLLTLAPAAIGLWIFLNPLLGSAIWDDIVLGAIIVVVSILAMFKIQE